MPGLSPLLQLEQQAFLEALLDTDREAARRVFRAVCGAEGFGNAMEKLVRPALDALGNQWETGEVALSQVYMSGRICEDLMDSLAPPPVEDRAVSPRTAIGVMEDHHALGKRMVLSVLRAGGIALRDYGCGRSVDELVERSRADGIRVLLVSALMLRSALRIKDLMAAVRAARLPLQVVAGGAPFTSDRGLAAEVGADATGYNASDALAITRRLLEGEA